MGREKSKSAGTETRQRTVLCVISEFGSDKAGTEGVEGNKFNFRATESRTEKLQRTSLKIVLVLDFTIL